MPYSGAITRPRRTIFVGITVVLLASLGLPRLEIRVDGRSLVPSASPQVDYDQQVRAAFGLRDQIVIVLSTDHPDGVFNLATLELVSELTDRTAALKDIGADAVTSLATERGNRVHTGTLKFRRLLDPMPRSEEQLQRLRRDIRHIELYTGTIVSRDERSAAILISVDPGVDRVALYGRVRDLAIARQDAHHRIRITGAPVAESLLGAYILDDLGVPPVLTGYPETSGGESAAGGVPGSFHELRVLVAGSVGLVPVAIAIMALVFLVAFRSLMAVLLPLGEVAACLVFVFGLMGFCGAPIYLPTTVMPVILTAIGLADEIHIFMRYRDILRRRRGADHIDAVRETMGQMWRPVTRTSITTAIAFLAFAISPIGAVRSFGLFTAVGVLFCLAWSLTVIPASLALARPGSFGRSGRRGVAATDPAVPSLLHRFTQGVIRKRIPIVAAALVVFVAAVPALRMLEVQDSWIDGFAPESEFRRATDAFNRDFLGMHVLLVTVDSVDTAVTGTVRAGDVQRYRVTLPMGLVQDPEELIGRWITLGDPAGADRRRWVRIDGATVEGRELVVTTDRRHGVLGRPPGYGEDRPIEFEIAPRALLLPETHELLCGLSRFIRGQSRQAVGGVLGPCEFLVTTNAIVSGRRDETRWVPDDAHRIETMWGHYQRVRGARRVREVIDERYARTVLTVYMKNANFIGTRQLMENIREYEQANLTPHGLSLGFAGDVAVSQTLIDAVVTTQIRSLLLSLAGILLVTSLMARSLWWGLCSVLPCATAVLVVFAVMGAFGVPLGVATSMFAGMTLGIGVDYAIHLMERYRLAVSQGRAGNDAIAEAVAATGPAVAVDALAVALGFGVLVLSQVPANARLGGLVVISVAGCFAATLVLLPALMALRRPSHG